MGRLFRYLPPFAGDYSGVGSALYELGGMLCIHDASGCTGNYVGFDEPRSYDSKQLVYCTGLRQNDAILGNEKIYIDKIVQAAKDMKPKFIAIVGSPVSLIIGFDFKGFAKEIEQLTGLPTFGFETGGMKGCYKDGIVMAVNRLLEYYAKDRRNVKNRKNTDKRVNIVGATPLDISEENIGELKNILAKEGYEINTVLSMGNTVEGFKNIEDAEINLAITQAGLLIAQNMEKKYKMPYLAGLPIGNYGKDIYFKCLKEVLETGKSKIIYYDNTKKQGELKKKAVVIEDGIIGVSIATQLYGEGYGQVYVYSPFGKDNVLKESGIEFTKGEEEILAAINREDCSLIIADPLLLEFRKNAENITMIGIPKYAVSSKLYHQRRKVYIGEYWEINLQKGK